MTVWTRLCFAQITAARKNRQFTSHKAVRLAYLFFATVLAAFLYVMFEARFIAPLQWWLPGVAPFGAARRGRDKSRLNNVALCCRRCICPRF